MQPATSASSGFNSRLYLQVFLVLMVFFNLAGIMVYTLIRLFFIEVPLEWSAELETLSKVLGVASFAALVISVLTILADAIEYGIWRRKQRTSTMAKMIYGGGLAIVIYFIVYS